MLPLDVPFVPEGDYPEFLADHRKHLSSVHFSLHDPALSDARQLLEHKDTKSIISGLHTLVDFPKYVLLNGRLHAPTKYFSPDAINCTAERLALLVDKAEIRGFIFSDPYYIQALADGHPELAGGLEAVPSVNAMLDSAGRAFAMLDMIETAGFKPPSKLVLDRSLNRDFDRLEQISGAIKTSHPDIKLHLIANEGCLLNCPYKPAHDAHVALVNEGLCGDRTFAMNRDFGCVRRFLASPESFLISPFIRPEDSDRYKGMIDGIKLCGRNKGIRFLKRVVSAYVAGEHHGNLLDLMDAMGDLADRVNIPNTSLPEDFLRRVAHCRKDCRECGWCAALAEKTIKPLDPGLPHL